MGTIKLTAKRQATFPVEVCEGLGIGPGDEVELIPIINDDGERVWQLKKATKETDLAWVGCLSQYASNAEDHSMDAVRESLAVERERQNKES